VPQAPRQVATRAVALLKESLAAFLDQDTAFGRLALTHVLLIGGDTMVTISLAGSLFFSISPEAAKGKVLLYLLLTMAPFAVVAPVLGPLIDTSRGARRVMIVLSGACRAVMCVIMAAGLKSLLVFPEAFTMLVLSKLYLVTKASLVPLLPDGPLGRRRGLHAAGGDPGRDSDEGMRSPMDRAPSSPKRAASRAASMGLGGQAGLATVNARLALLASLAGFVAALPAVTILKLGGAPSVLRFDALVFAAGAISALRIPIVQALSKAREGNAREGPAREGPAKEGSASERSGRSAGPVRRGSFGRARGPLEAMGPRAVTHPEVLLAVSAMSVIRGLVGFLTFFLAFALRREHFATWWFGLMLVASAAGSLSGVLLVPRVRRLASEQALISALMWSVALVAVGAGLAGDMAIQALLGFTIGLAAGAAKPSFDALVQRFVPDWAQGRSFARFETRLQLVWVLGGILPVVTALPLVAGDIIVAAVAGVAGVSYLTGRRALRHGPSSA
jgi:hypothetical protein